MHRASLQGCQCVYLGASAWWQSCSCGSHWSRSKETHHFRHVCTIENPPLTPVNIHWPSMVQQNKNQQIRHQRLMWKDKSRKWIWKPPPALCHIPLHSSTDKQNTSRFRWTTPFLQPFPLCPFSQVFDLCGKNVGGVKHCCRCS